MACLWISDYVNQLIYTLMKKILLTSIVVFGTSLMTFAQKDTVKAPVIKDTIKSKQTGVIYSIENMLAFGPQTDSTKTKGKVKSDTIKSETKMNPTGYLPASSSMIAFGGPQTDSTKTKSTTTKPDSSTTKPVDKRTGSIQMEKSLFKNEILEA